MHLRTLDGTDEFHCDRVEGRRWLLTGKFVEVKPVETPKEDTKWSIEYAAEEPPIIRAFCPNCKNTMSASGPRAPYSKFFHICFGGPDSCPYELASEYFSAWKKWSAANEKQKAADRDAQAAARKGTKVGILVGNW